MKKGFTLIELLVVISIIGVLSSLLMANVSGIRERARDAKRKADLKEIKNALRMYHNDYDDYPADNGKNPDQNPKFACCDWGEPFVGDGAIYMKQLPEDPLGEERPYSYKKGSTKDDFLLWAILENLSDRDIADSQANCNVSSPTEGGYYVCED